MEIALRGIGVSPGIAIGPALLFGVHSVEIPRREIDDADAEIKRFETAIEAVRADLNLLRDQTAEEFGDYHGNIFEAHMLVLDDVILREEVEKGIRERKTNAEFLVDDLIRRYAKAVKKVVDPRFRERTVDLMDVGNRILSKLMDAEGATLAHLHHPSVIVGHDLSPSDTANIDLANTLALATDASGPTSHTAILARAMEIPAVVGLKYVSSHVSPNDTIILDGTDGYVIIRPDESTLSEFAAEKKRQESERLALLRVDRDRSNVTQDGHELPIMANLEFPGEVPHSKRVKVQGVGLFRTEYLFLNRHSLPSEDEQFRAYAEVAEAMAPESVILRTLDIGGDKFASQFHGEEELNPQLGWRAVRFCLDRPDVFKAQLRAMYRASVRGNVQIMFPMISGVDEWRRVKAVAQEVRTELESSDVAFDPDIKLGSMIEIPSAVTVADQLAQECDFFSIGTNDLIQYSLAVDRVNERIAYMYEPAHPAVLKMIQQTIAAAKAHGIPCGICGEMAGDPVFTVLLMGMGIDSLSMSSVAVPMVRAEIANSKISAARRFAKKVLELPTSAEVRAMLLKQYKQRRELTDYLEKLAPDEPEEE